MSNKLTRLAHQILSVEDDLPFRFDWSRDPETCIDDFEFYIFEQTWSSTALGFGGIGGQAITSGYTVVAVPVTTNQRCAVYFNGRFAYYADWSDTLREDLSEHNMASVAQSYKYPTSNEEITE